MKSYKQMCDSTKEIAKELYEAIKKGGGGIIEIVDKVEKGNQNAVTSNAVAESIPEDFPEVVDEVKKGNKNAVTSNAVYTTCNGILSNIPKVTSEIKKGNLDVPTSDAIASYIPEMPGVVDIVEKGNSNAVTSNAVANAIPKIEGAVDIVEKNNMNAVTSNAVAKAIPKDFPDIVDTVEKGNKNAVTSNAVAINTPKVVDIIEEGNQNAVSSNRIYQTSMELVNDIKDMRQEIPKTTTKIETGNINVPTSDAVAKAIPEGSRTIDKVEESNMNPITSNAVYKYTPQKTDKIETGNINVPTSDAVAKAIPEISGAVDVVEQNNMNAVTSNAVAKALDIEKGTGKLIINVTDPNNNNIPNAKITISSINNIQTEITSKKEQGLFILEYGIYLIAVQHTDYYNESILTRFNTETKTQRVMLTPFTDIETTTLYITVLNIKARDTKLENAKIVFENYEQYAFYSGNLGLAICTIPKYLIKNPITFIISCVGYHSFKDTFTYKEDSNYISIGLIPNEYSNINFTGFVYDGKGLLVNAKITETSTGISTKINGSYDLIIDANLLPEHPEFIISKPYYKSEKITINIPEYYVETYKLENINLFIESDPFVNSYVEGIAKYTNKATSEIKIASNITFELQNKSLGDKYIVTTDKTGVFKSEAITAGAYNIYIKNNPYYETELIENVFFVRHNDTTKNIIVKFKASAISFKLKIVFKESGDEVANTKIGIYSDKKYNTLVTVGTTNELGKITFDAPYTENDTLYAKIYITNSDVRTAIINNVSTGDAKIKI